MKINYELKLKERKPLVAAISHELGMKAKYHPAQNHYEIGEYIVDKNGTVSGPDNCDLIAGLQGLHSIRPITEEYDDAPIADSWMVDEPDFTDWMSEREELGLGRDRLDYPGEDGMQASDVPDSFIPEDDRLTVEVPLDGFTPEKLDNLAKLVNAKAHLIKGAIFTNDLPIRQTADTLQFPWFWEESMLTSDEITAFTTLIAMLCKTAKEKKRITAKEKPIEGSPKYAMRCFLLSLGFIGDEYKTSRRILLSRLEGSAAWKSEREKEVAVHA